MVALAVDREGCAYPNVEALLLLAHIPRSKICVMPAASFGFHQALRPEMTTLWNGYPSDVKAWITQHGGLQAPRTTLIWLRAPGTYKFFHRCA
jgi:hypothetical protein